MSKRGRVPDVWAAALVRFEDGYGSPCDFADPIDVVCFWDILEEGMRDKLTAELTEALRLGATKLAADAVSPAVPVGNSGATLADDDGAAYWKRNTAELLDGA